jgi:hypothetical protein
LSPSASGQLFSSQTLNSARFNVFEVDRGVGAQLRHDAPTNNKSLRLHHPPSVKVANSHPDIPKDKSRGIDSMIGVIGDQTHGFRFLWK